MSHQFTQHICNLCGGLEIDVSAKACEPMKWGVWFEWYGNAGWTDRLGSRGIEVSTFDTKNEAAAAAVSMRAIHPAYSFTEVPYTCPDPSPPAPTVRPVPPPRESSMTLTIPDLARRLFNADPRVQALVGQADDAGANRRLGAYAVNVSDRAWEKETALRGEAEALARRVFDGR